MPPTSVFNIPFNNGEGNCCNTSNDQNTSSQSSSTSSNLLDLLKARTEDAPQPVLLDAMESIVASEMHGLSVTEREVIYEDIHGVSRPEEESPEMIQHAIVETRNELACMRLKGAYNKAVFLNPEYVNSDAFILMFLRALKYNPKATAQRIIDHFKYKQDLFGYDNVGRDLMYDDLDEGSKQALSTGAVQFLKSKDSAGRTLVFFKFDAMEYDCVESQLRATWYVMMRGLSDPEIQRSGIVIVVYNTGYASTNNHLDFLMKSSIYDKSMPHKLFGVHFFYDSAVMKPVLSMLQMITSSHTRQRIRAHFGSHLEVRYSLQNFGIPYGSLPVDLDGNMDTLKLQAFVQDHITISAQRRQAEAGLLLHPLSSDVLMGRGWHQQEHPGNLDLARIVEEHRQEYKAARKLNKTKLNWTIVETVKESGGRFLQRSQASDSCRGIGWIEANDESARDKVSKHFRTKTKRAKDTTTNNTAITSTVASEPNTIDDIEDSPSVLEPLQSQSMQLQ